MPNDGRSPKHYVSEYQHWDFVLDTGMGYFEGNASKYLSRWRTKGGLDDLNKAKHYIDKMLERISLTPHWPDVGSNVLFAEHFVTINKLSQTEGEVIVLLVTWRHSEDLFQARRLIDELIRGNTPVAPKPVPLTEENHYAEREGQDNEDQAGTA